MKVGRPHNSKTPLWHNTAAIKVRIYLWMSYYWPETLSKSDCARRMSLSRTTVIKWWNIMAWDDAKMKAFSKVKHYYTTHWGNFDENLAVQELNMPLDNILLDVATFTEMSGKYIWF